MRILDVRGMLCSYPHVHACTLALTTLARTATPASRATPSHVYVCEQVMESAWASLQDGISRAHCFDDVIRAHDSYLIEILDRALLAPQHEALYMQVS